METTPVLAWIQQHGLWGVFALMVAENMGVPFPTQAGFLYAVTQVRTGQFSFTWAFTVITLGHLMGGMASYLLGLYSNNAVARYWERSEKMQKARTRLEGWYERYGPLALVLGRMVGYLRPFSSFVAGLAKVKLVPFLLWTTVGTVIINFLCWVSSEAFVYVWLTYPHLRWVIGGILVTFTGGLLISASIYAGIKAWRRVRRNGVDAEPDPG